MRKRLLSLTALFIIFFSLSYFSLALAQSDPYGLSTAATRAQLPTSVAGGSSISEVIGNVIKYALGFIGIVFFLLVLYAGFLWMSAMGNAEKSEKAKAILETAVVGLVLILGAYAITQFVFTGLSGQSSSVPQVTTPQTGGPGAVCTTDTDCADPGFSHCKNGTCQI